MSDWNLTHSVQYKSKHLQLLLYVNIYAIAYDDVIKWTYFPRYWLFVRGIHRSSVNSPNKVSDAELWCFLWSASEQTVEYTLDAPLIWDVIASIMTSL